MASEDKYQNVEQCKMRDVARLAGVSIATVSRVINGSDNVSDQKRAKVLSIASDLRYSPNAHAAELGRANGGIPKVGRIRDATWHRRGRRTVS